MKRVSYMLIAAGLLVMLFPYAREKVADWRQEALLRDTERMLISTAAANREAEVAYGQLSRLLQQESEAAGAESAAWEGPEQNGADTGSSETGQMEASQNQKQDQAIAILTIDKIGLRLPVLEGVTEENMKVTAAHMKETAPLGEVGNSALAAHRARTKGRLFNRLNELEIGDSIKVDSTTGPFTYTVYQILRVEPDDVSVLKANGTDKILTLITCDPVIHATRRLIIQAKSA